MLRDPHGFLYSSLWTHRQRPLQCDVSRLRYWWDTLYSLHQVNESHRKDHVPYSTLNDNAPRQSTLSLDDLAKAIQDAIDQA
jgi:hypothetical protein